MQSIDLTTNFIEPYVTQLIEIIFLVISATISGCDGWKAIRNFSVIKLAWLRKFLPYKEGIPADIF